MKVRAPKKKSFADYLTKEDHLQSAVVKYIRLQYPKVLVVHVPNEGKRSPFERYKAKVLGITAGVPDILIFKKGFRNRPSLTYVPDASGLAIELKVKPNEPTVEQTQILGRLTEAGWKAEVCYDFDSAKKLIDDYLN